MKFKTYKLQKRQYNGQVMVMLATTIEDQPKGKLIIQSDISSLWLHNILLSNFVLFAS